MALREPSARGLEKAVRRLEQNHGHMVENGVGQEPLENVRCSLERMKKQLDLLRMTKQNVWDSLEGEADLYPRVGAIVIRS